MTRVVNLRVEPFDVYIGREGRGFDGYFGNPFPLGPGQTREGVIRSYRAYFFDRIAKDAGFRQAVEALRGKTLGCFCKPLTCHGDVIVKYLDGAEALAL